MCRNIHTLFNFEPPRPSTRSAAAAHQYVRKVSGFTKPSKANEEAFSAAVARGGRRDVPTDGRARDRRRRRTARSKPRRRAHARPSGTEPPRRREPRLRGGWGGMRLLPRSRFPRRGRRDPVRRIDVLRPHTATLSRPATRPRRRHRPRLDRHDALYRRPRWDYRGDAPGPTDRGAEGAGHPYERRGPRGAIT